MGRLMLVCLGGAIGSGLRYLISVVAARWLQSYDAGVPAPVVLASTNYRALEVIPLEVLQEHSVDVPSDLSGLD